MRPDLAIARGIFAMALLALVGCATPGNGVSRKSEATSQKQEAARIHTELGQQYLKQGKLELAQEKLDKALQFDPNYVDAHTVLGLLYETIGDTAKAEQHYNRAAELKPKGGNENNNYGAFLCRLGRFDESQTYFDRAIADPFYQTPGVALTNSGTCLLHAGHRDEAEQRLRIAVDHSPTNGDALLQLGNVLYDKGEYLKARAFVQRYEATTKPSADALLLGRNVELKLGNADAAADYARRLQQAFPTPSRRARWRSRVDHEAGGDETGRCGKRERTWIGAADVVARRCHCVHPAGGRTPQQRNKFFSR